MKCSDTLEKGDKVFHCCLEDGHDGDHGDDNGSYWNDNPVLRKYTYSNIFGVLFRRIGVENWTEQYFLEDSRRHRLNREEQAPRGYSPRK